MTVLQQERTYFTRKTFFTGSLVTVPQQDPQIDDQSDLLKSNIQIAGSTQMFYVLNASRDVSEEFDELLDR